MLATIGAFSLIVLLSLTGAQRRDKTADDMFKTWKSPMSCPSCLRRFKCPAFLYGDYAIKARLRGTVERRQNRYTTFIVDEVIKNKRYELKVGSELVWVTRVRNGCPCLKMSSRKNSTVLLMGFHDVFSMKRSHPAPRLFVVPYTTATVLNECYV